jgi:hypothetical protein
MYQNSWITLETITSCEHEIELDKEIHNNKATLASYYGSYSKILSMVIEKPLKYKI